MRTRAILVPLLFLLLLPLSLRADPRQENRAQLEQIRQRIEASSRTLQDQQQQELSLLRDLALINTGLQQTEGRIARLERQQRQGEKELTRQRSEIEEGKRGLRERERKLHRRLVAVYKEGETGVLKVLFSADSPSELAEQYEYLSRILARDRELMSDFRDSLEQQRTRLQGLKRLQQEQQQGLELQEAERAGARSARRLQAKLLGQLRRDKSVVSAEIAQLKEKAERLEELMNNLESQQARGEGDFAVLKGRLPWPVNGALLVGFGTQKNAEFGTLYESKGIEIAAKKGTRMKAIASGKVVFANWFKGYGNLLIVAHAGGYHSLYAQTEQLLKRSGERVEAGEPLAVAGLAGAPGVYLEVREAGNAVNPLSWLRPR